MAGGVGARLGSVARDPANIADVWYAWVGEHEAELDDITRRYLSDEERGHLSVYRNRVAAERYVVTRALVRAVLAAQLGVPPADVKLSRTVEGKPVIAEGLHFNVSHSGDLVLLAVCQHRAIGIDVERRRDVDRVHALMERWLTHVEHEDMAALITRGMDPSDAFLRVWSLKEAKLKALGVGIAGASTADLAQVHALSLDSLLETLPPIRAGGGYVGALAFA